MSGEVLYLRKIEDDKCRNIKAARLYRFSDTTKFTLSDGSVYEVNSIDDYRRAFDNRFVVGVEYDYVDNVYLFCAYTEIEAMMCKYYKGCTCFIHNYSEVCTVPSAIKHDYLAIPENEDFRKLYAKWVTMLG